MDCVCIIINKVDQRVTLEYIKKKMNKFLKESENLTNFQKAFV